MRAPNKEIWNGDYKCINIRCERDIPANIVEKQFTHPKNRVCYKCRNKHTIEWKCVGCNTIISDNVKRIGTFYCSTTCRYVSKSKRTNIVKPKQITFNIKNCVYCNKRLTHKNAIKFCDTKCFSRNRTLEKHKQKYKQDMINRANIRHRIKYPNSDKEKMYKNKEYNQFYHRRWYNIKKLVTKINNKQTHI